jgi:ABC-type glycerol-3-phosphate transport system permease component
MCAGHSIFLKIYNYAFQRMNFLNGTENSAIITVISISLVLITASSTANFLVRNKWKINGILLTIFAVALMVLSGSDGSAGQNLSEGRQR